MNSDSDHLAVPGGQVATRASDASARPVVDGAPTEQEAVFDALFDRAAAKLVTGEPMTKDEANAYFASSLVSPTNQVYFRAGLLACREYMARFVEAESPTIAASIRANWWPSLGDDLGPPRRLDWNELTDGGDEGPWTLRADISPTMEALPIALSFLWRIQSQGRDGVTESGATSEDAEGTPGIVAGQMK